MGYKLVTTNDYFKHLDGSWCKMDTKEIMKLTTTFYELWDQCMHVTKFAKHVKEQQKYLNTTGITISKGNKLQFYTKQMINSRMFDKTEIMDWENRSKDVKT